MNRAAIGFTDSILPAVVRTSTLGETINAVRRYELDVFLVADDPQQQAHYRNESEKSLQEAARQITAHDGTIWAEDLEERRTFDIVAGIVRITRYPRAAPMSASAMPVFPLVDSTIVPPGRSAPDCSAASTRA